MEHTGRTTGRSRWVAALTIGALVATANIALADNLQNDVVAGGNDTTTVGVATTVKYSIGANNGDGQNGCNAADGSPAVVTLNVPAAVTASLASLTFSTCGTQQSVSFSASAIGQYDITASVSDGGTGTYNTNPAKFTLKVNAAPTSADTTAPTWSCVPAVSDGVWHADNQSSSCTASDATTGPASPDSFTLWTLVDDGTEDANASTGRQEVCDAVTPTANCAYAGPITGWKIDRKGPTNIAFQDAPATVILGSTFPGVTCTAADGGSGLATCDVTGQDSSTIGTKTLTATATDNVGNQSSSTTTYNVVFAWTGFLRPVDNLPTLNTVKAGSAVPVKFQLGGDQGLSVIASGYPRSFAGSCDASAGTDAIEETATAGQSVLQYDSTTDTYTYVWKTEKAWAGSCRQLHVKLADGTLHLANFKLTK